jgi:hypothetical protein
MEAGEIFPTETHRLRKASVRYSNQVRSCTEPSVSLRLLLTTLAVEAIKLKNRDDKGCLVFHVQELEWFSKNAYNLGLTNCPTWQTQNTLRLFDSCLEIMDNYPNDVPVETLQDLSLKIMCSYFIAGAGCVSLARGCDSVEEQLQCYLKLRKHVAAFDKEHSGWLELLGENKDDQIHGDLMMKFATLLVFDFEAAVCLKEWEVLCEVVGKASVCKDTTAYKAMADILLRAKEVPTQGTSAWQLCGARNL